MASPEPWVLLVRFSGWEALLSKKPFCISQSTGIQAAIAAEVAEPIRQAVTPPAPS